MTQDISSLYENDLDPPIGLLQARRRIYQFIDEAVLTSAVVQALTLDGKLVNKECDLWDFKREVSNDALGLASICLDIAAFHNTYGGFLIIGVEELDASFSPVGIHSGDIDFRQIYDRLKVYTDCDIDCSHVEVENESSEGVQGSVLAIIHIPKRRPGKPPIVFVKNGPNIQANKSLFRSGDFPIRVGHETKIAASKDDFTLLQTERSQPVFAGVSEITEMLATIRSTRRLESNLPEKAMICAQFVGRTEILARLWQWMADAFSRTKVLAGDGGKGKTSIAYQFASEVVTVRPDELMQVIWLSAKKRQFFGLTNSYSDLGDPDYEDLDSMLRVICRNSGVTENELSEGASLNRLKSLARAALETIPAFIVIDDVDSLESNEQRRVFEAATQIAGSRSRFLITTRANNSYSSDLCINIPGLTIKDFSSFILTVTDKIGLNPFTKGAIEQLHGSIEGSPLLAESIVRLVRQGLSLSPAIAQWKTHSGEDARSAVLKKEVDSLDSESRRTLLAMACLRECSRSELQQLTGYGTVKLGDCIDRLQALFLVAAPMVTEEEARFSISDVVRTLILETRESLAVDSSRLLSDAKELQGRKKVSPSAQNWIVGAAINQANAQLGGNQVKEALDTIRTALARAPRHRDLLSMLGRCFLATSPPDLTAARDAFRLAHEGGNRKPVLFQDWYQAEVTAEHWPGAVAVAGYALKAGMDNAHWHHHRAYARVAHAALRLRHNDRAGAISEYDAAANDLATCIRDSKGLIRQDHISESAEINDRLWNLHSTSAASPSQMFAIVERAIARGDMRIVMFKRLVDALRAHVLPRGRGAGDTVADSIAGMIRSARDRLNARKERLPASESKIGGFLSQVDDIEVSPQGNTSSRSKSSGPDAR